MRHSTPPTVAIAAEGEVRRRGGAQSAGECAEKIAAERDAAECGKVFRIVPKSSRNDPKMIPKPKSVRKVSEKSPKSRRKVAEMIPKSRRKIAEMIPKSWRKVP